MDADHLELFVKGSIVGHLIGDALGYPWSGSDPSKIPNQLEMIEGPGGELPGEYTSLGAFSLATISSLNECEGLDQEDLAEKFYDVYVGGYMTPNGDCYDVSTTTAQAIDNFSNAMPLDRCGVNSENSDSDAVSRMLPIALFYSTESIETIVLKSQKACQITHTDICNQVICAVYCLLIRNLLLQKAEKVFDTLLNYYTEQAYIDALKQLKESSNASNFVLVSGGRPEAVDCFWVAWQSFSKYEHDYRFSTIEAIKKGKDTNATGALGGSFAGVANGLNDIPATYLSTIKLTTEVMETVMKFTDTVVNRILEK